VNELLIVVHFADHVQNDNLDHGRERRIEVEKSGPVGERKLLALIRAFAGSGAKRCLPR
jgi:hypothetical protein